MDNNKENVKLLNGFCNPKCIYYKLEKLQAFYDPNAHFDMHICTYGGKARSFGCMNACHSPEGPVLEKTEE